MSQTLWNRDLGQRRGGGLGGGAFLRAWGLPRGHNSPNRRFRALGRGRSRVTPDSPGSAQRPPISEDATVIRAYDALALIPTARTAFSYQPKDLKSVRRAVPKRFLFARVALCLP
jgi:hypothetical protein